MLILALLLQTAEITPKSPSEIVAASPASEWVDIKPDDLLIMQLAPNRDGQTRRVVIQLMPPPFSQPWIANIRTLAKAHWWDGTSINRVQDNYVVQWGDATEKKKLPLGMIKPSELYYSIPWASLDPKRQTTAYDPAAFRDAGEGAVTDTRWLAHAMRSTDVYAAGVLKFRGWWLASDLRSVDQGRRTWPVHCYGMVGVGRNLSPDTGSGAELYTVIGHAPRHLDRNIALVGRVVEGIENLSSLPRGTGALGFYEKPEQRVPIISIRLAAELPDAERPQLQYLSTESISFAAYADARANRRDAFFIVPAGGADICNVPVPIRTRP